MTSTIKVNNIQNQCGANIINESSNTITIGASGDVDGTEGWINIQETSNSVTGQTFISHYRRNNNNFR